MTPLNWQADNPAHPAAHNPHSNLFGFVVGAIGGAAVSFLVIGFFAGYFAARWTDVPGSPRIAVQDQPDTFPTAPTPQPPAPSAPLPPIDPKSDHIRGDLAKAKVAVIEYSDFECPFCKRHHPTMKQVMDAYKDDVVWVYRHFPLSFHANAQKEAEASECANELGGNDAFWKYADAIFDRTTAGGDGFPLENLAPLATEIGLNEAKFKSCLDGGKYAKHVQDEMDAGAAAGVQGTPGNFVLNLKTKESREVSGAQPFSAFQSKIDAALKS